MKISAARPRFESISIGGRDLHEVEDVGPTRMPNRISNTSAGTRSFGRAAATRGAQNEAAKIMSSVPCAVFTPRSPSPHK